MRIRTVKPDFWSHPVMARQTDSTKLLALGLLNMADDEGYFYADPKMVRNAIRPMDDDSGSTTVSLRELSEIGYILLRTHPTHGEIGYIPSFLVHQVINKPKDSNIKELYDYGSDTVVIRDGYGLEGKGTGKGLEGIPPTPKGGGVQSPRRKKRKSNPDNQCVEVNTPTMIRINGWFGRRPDTLWTITECRALDEINPSEAELEGMEAFYTADENPNEPLFRRTNVITMLNNWRKTELDKARGYARKQRGAA